jgi:hypothetical protein
MNPSAVKTAQRNLASRIERFLDGLDRESRAPSLRETWCLEDALLLLESMSYAGGEHAMMQAEKADIFGTPKALALIVPTAQLRPVSELRQRLADILKDADWLANSEVDQVDRCGRLAGYLVKGIATYATSRAPPEEI